MPFQTTCTPGGARQAWPKLCQALRKFCKAWQDFSTDMGLLYTRWRKVVPLGYFREESFILRVRMTAKMKSNRLNWLSLKQKLVKIENLFVNALLTHKSSSLFYKPMSLCEDSYSIYFVCFFHYASLIIN